MWPAPTTTRRVFDDLYLCEETRSPDPRWHYRVALRWPLEVAPATGPLVPTIEAPARLGWYRRGALDVEVWGHVLEREIDPLHWLEELCALEDKEIVTYAGAGAGAAARSSLLDSRFRGNDAEVPPLVRLRSGLVGDVVACWSHDGAERVGRLFASKWGGCMFLVGAATDPRSYEGLADEMFTAIGSFEALDDGEGPLSEPVQRLSFDAPVVWTTHLPGSWTYLASAPEEQVHGFQAVNVRGFDLEHCDGKLGLGVARREVANKPRQASRMFLNAIDFHGIALEHQDFDDEEVEAPFERSWLCVTPCEWNGKRGEVRCRVMMHAEVWVVAGVLGPQRADDAWAWAHNKRALDVVTSTLELG